MGSGKHGLTFGLILGATALLQLAGCTGGGEQKHAPPPPEAGYVVVKSEPVPLVAELAGRTSAYEVSEVRPQVSGVVQARLFTEGSIVRAGQTLYQIDPSLYRAAADQARANLANAIANESSARARAERYRPLAQIEAVSKQDYTDARAAANQARAVVAQQRAALQTTNINLHYTRVPAPIGGRIGRSLITTGALVTTGQTDPLTTIQRLDPIFVDIQQSSAELLALRRALAQGGAIPTRAQVQLILEDGTLYGNTGTLEFAEAVVDQNTGTVTLRARFPNSAGLLLPGMFVRARVAQETVANGILVPQAGVSHDASGKATVMLVGPGNKAMQRMVTAPRTIGDKWLVTARLNSGDRVIVEGLGRIKSGQKVVPVPAGSPPRQRGRPGAQGGGTGRRAEGQ
jgi:membrane fusion protein (multidrug efflux system)